jgi:hypothetical protein
LTACLAEPTVAQRIVWLNSVEDPGGSIETTVAHQRVEGAGSKLSCFALD